LLLLASVLALSLTASLPVPARAQCAASWTIVPSPNGNFDDNFLGDISAISANDIWAVGTTGSGLSPLNTLTEHWNGSSWSVLPSPNGVFTTNFLTGVDGVAGNDVWAVGYSDNNSVADNQSRTLILHWNGSSWSKMTSPNTSFPVNRLHAVDAVSANEVWAVGTSYDYTNYRMVIMRWNGTSWRMVSTPTVPGSNFDFLYGIDSLSASDVWVVGTQQDTLEQTLVLHWNGSSWSVVSSPQIGPYGNNMLKVDAVNDSDIWAVGYHLTVFGFTQPYQTSVFHYDGASWNPVSSPNVNQLNNYLFDVVGIAANDAWAVGFWDTGNALNTMIQHWDGNSWTIVSSPNPGAYSNELVAIDAVSADDIWAVGRWTDGLVGVNTFVLRYTASCSNENTLHVANIAPSFLTRSGKFQVKAAITIQNSNQAPINGAAVSVSVTLPSGAKVNRSATTNSSGTATVSVSSLQTGTYTFTVTNVSKAGWTYDPASNVETSDSITVTK
jgi:hypothetical protein